MTSGLCICLARAKPEGWADSRLQGGRPALDRTSLRGLAKIKLPFMAQGFWPLARRERRAYPAHGSVRSEQRSQRPKDQARMGKVILARPLNPATPPVRFHFFIP